MLYLFTMVSDQEDKNTLFRYKTKICGCPWKTPEKEQLEIALSKGFPSTWNGKSFSHLECLIQILEVTGALSKSLPSSMLETKLVIWMFLVAFIALLDLPHHIPSDKKLVKYSLFIFF